MAARQHQLFTWAQAAELGVSAGVIRWHWERIEPGVYRTADFEPPWIQRLHGVRALRAVLARRLHGAAATESELETRFLQLVREAGLRPPARQHVVWDGYAVVERPGYVGAVLPRALAAWS